MQMSLLSPGRVSPQKRAAPFHSDASKSSLFLIVIPAKAGMHLAVALARHPREGGIQRFFQLHLLPMRSEEQGFRPSKAGRVTFLC